MKIKREEFSCAEEITEYRKYTKTDPLNCHKFRYISGKIMTSGNWVRYRTGRGSDLVTGA